METRNFYYDVNLHAGDWSLLCKLYGKNLSDVIEKAIAKCLKEQECLPDEIRTQKKQDYFMGG